MSFESMDDHKRWKRIQCDSSPHELPDGYALMATDERERFYYWLNAKGEECPPNADRDYVCEQASKHAELRRKAGLSLKDGSWGPVRRLIF